MLHDLLSHNPVVSFSHVRRDANKVVNLLSNQGVECGIMLRIGSMEEFRQAKWRERCQALACTDLRLAKSREEDDAGLIERARLHEVRPSGFVHP